MRLSFLSALLSICLLPGIKSQCSTYIQMNPLGVEGCVLPQIVATQQFLLPCSAPAGFNQLEEGDFAYIEYVESGCANICQISPEVDITCLSFPVGVGEEEEDEIKVHPTIVQDRVYIEGEGIVQVEVYNNAGKQIMIIKKPDVSSVDVGSLISGIYFIKVMTKLQTEIKRILKP